MKRVVVFLIVSFTLGLVSNLVQAEELTLDQCINMAIEKRASIVRARGNASQAGAEKLSALGAFLPNVRAGYSYSKGKTMDMDPVRTIPTVYDTMIVTIAKDGDTARDAMIYPVAYESYDEQDEGPSKSWSLSADMYIFNAANFFNYAAASASNERARLNVLASEQDLISSVKISYYAYLAAVENVDVQEEAVLRAEEQLKLIESRFELGSASKSDVLRQKVLAGNDHLALLRAKNGVIRAHADLCYTIGLDPREDHKFSTKYRVREYAGTLDEAIGFSIGHNPRLLSAQKMADQSRHTLRAAKASYLPYVAGSASYRKFTGTQGYPYDMEYSSNSYSVGFSVSWNIFDGFSREQRVNSAKVFRNNSLADLADSRNLTVASVKTSYSEIGQYKKQIEVSQENVAAAQEDLRITQEKYNLGAATILDLLNAQVTLKEAQVALIRVQFDLNLAVARLENAMGKM
ncbi:MAG: TolC family protein [candidate division Zixibacteria bacterium]|nr:TolC family protein [candidate division Zixibacteria bacterium]